MACPLTQSPATLPLHTLQGTAVTLYVCAGAAPSPKAAKGGKLPLGAEATQINAAAGLRIMTLHDDCKRQLADMGAIPVLLPLLATPLNPVRWSIRQVPYHHCGFYRSASRKLLRDWCACRSTLPWLACRARVQHCLCLQATVANVQALLNMAMSHEIALQLEKEGAPNHIHGMNLARVRMEHDPTLTHTASLAALAGFLTEKLMRVPEEPPPDPKGGSAKKGGVKGA